MPNYTTHEQLEKTLSPWGIVRLRVHELELTYEAKAGSAAIWLAQNRLYEAIHEYAKSLGAKSQ